MSFFNDIEIDRTQELPRTEGEAVRRLLYTIRNCAEGVALAISDKTAKEWVAVNSGWVKLIGWTMEDMNDATENPFHPDDFESLLLVHSENNLAGPYRIRIRKKGHSNYKWYEMDSFSILYYNRIFRFCLLEKT